MRTLIAMACVAAVAATAYFVIEYRAADPTLGDLYCKDKPSSQICLNYREAN